MDWLRSFDLLYLANPYSKYPPGIFASYFDVCRLAGRLVRAGVRIYSPIAHSHSIAIHGDVEPMDHDLWLSIDMKMAKACDGLLIAKFHTWDRSYGVGREAEHFMGRGLPVLYIDPVKMEVHE